MKYLGIDYGSKRVGIAISDENGILAFPRVVIENSSLLIEKLSRIIKEEGVSVVVLGESKDFQGEHNPIMKDIFIFREQVETEIGPRVVFEPEVLTSKQAMQIQGDNEMNDASAATIILQGYLDRMNGPRDFDDEEM